MFKLPPTLAANFLPQDSERRARRHTAVLAVFFSLLVACVAAFGAFASYTSAVRGTTVLTSAGRAPVITDIRRLVFGPDSVRAEQPAGDPKHMKILILGIGGAGHMGSQLTDTIILADLDLEEKKVALLSIPRDLAYPLNGGTFEKINAVNAYAEQDHPGEGAERTAEAFEKLLDIHIDHVVRIDFGGFRKLIDAVGGVDVNVERSFVDTQYPTLDDLWMTVTFKKGPQHMDGERALIYARSRHGNNGEGSDFARSRRQQLVMLALREKLLSLNTIADPRKLNALYSTISANVQTDLTLWSVLQASPLLAEFSRERVTMHVLTDAPDGELVSGMINGAFMLFPKKPDWSDIRTLAQHPFPVEETATSVTTSEENVAIELKNGTSRTGFAAQAAAKLERSGYTVTAFSNAVRRGQERTTIFDLTGGKKPLELARLRRTLSADVSSVTATTSPEDPPGTRRIVLNDGLQPERIGSPNVDFFVMLGEASYSFVTEQEPYAHPTTP